MPSVPGIYRSTACRGRTYIKLGIMTHAKHPLKSKTSTDLEHLTGGGMIGRRWISLRPTLAASAGLGSDFTPGFSLKNFSKPLGGRAHQSRSASIKSERAGERFSLPNWRCSARFSPANTDWWRIAFRASRSKRRAEGRM
jgi:hypothetical protein